MELYVGSASAKQHHCLGPFVTGDLPTKDAFHSKSRPDFRGPTVYRACSIIHLPRSSTVDQTRSRTTAQLTASISQAELHRSAQPGEAPLGEWLVLRLKSLDALGEPAAASATEKSIAASTAATPVPVGDKAAERKLVLTAGGVVVALIE